MQLNYSIKKGPSILLCLCLFSIAFGREDAVGMEEKEFKYTNIKVIKKEIEELLEEHSKLLDSSNDKDIVVFLGNSGAGKSTLINYLSEKELKVTRCGKKIILENPGAMAIGGGGTSETHLPGYIQANDLLFYDLPGFKDTRGTATNLANACFLQNIIEKAKSVKLGCVASMDQLTSERGTSFYGFLNDVKRLIPNQPIEDFSALIITKSALNREDLGRYLLEYDLLLKSDLILKWIENGQMSQMSKPDQDGINQSDRSHILNVIKNTKPQKIEHIDVGVIYNVEDRSRIKGIYDEEIQKISDRLINENVLSETFSSLSIEKLKERKEYLEINFYPQGSSDFEKSTLLNFLKPISVHTYDQSQKEMERLLQNKRIFLLSRINCEIMERERADANAQKEQADKDREATQLKLAETKKLTSEAETKNVFLESENQALTGKINLFKEQKAEIVKLTTNAKVENTQLLIDKHKIEKEQSVRNKQYIEAVLDEVTWWNYHRKPELFSGLPEAEQRKLQERREQADKNAHRIRGTRRFGPHGDF